MKQDMVYVGMDLGTFKTSVASANGRRGVVPSAVGWPKDHIARGMLGRDIVFGDDIVDQRLALHVVRPFEKGILKYTDQSDAGMSDEQIERHKQAAKLLVKHAVSLTQPPPGAPVFGVIGAPSRATIVNKQFLIEAAGDAFDAVLIVAEPFTVAYGMNCLSNTLVIDIGAGTIDICPMYGAYPAQEDQITLAIGGDAVDEEFFNRMRQSYPEAQLSMNMARKIKEKHGFVHDLNEVTTVTLPVDGKPSQFNVTAPLKEACQVLVAPIVDGLRELIAKFDPEFQRSLLSNVLLGGGGSQLTGLDRLIEQALEPYGGGNVTKAYDSLFAGATGALKLAMSMPDAYWEQLRKGGDKTASGVESARTAA